MFRVFSFVIVQTRNSHMSPVGDCINQPCPTHAVGYYSAVKRTGRQLIHAAVWMGLKIITLKGAK